MNENITDEQRQEMRSAVEAKIRDDISKGAVSIGPDSLTEEEVNQRIKEFTEFMFDPSKVDPDDLMWVLDPSK